MLPLDIERDVTLILTAAVRVNPGVPGVTAPDPAAREEEYAESLRYYLQEHPRVRRIVLAESSGWPLARFEDAATDNPLGKEVEILQLACNDFPGHLGKGYGEALLLDRALSASRFETRYLAKLTGRQRLANLTGLLEKLPADFAVCVDLRDHGLYERFGYPGAGRYCDTRFFVASRPLLRRAPAPGLRRAPHRGGIQPGGRLLPGGQSRGRRAGRDLPLPRRAALPRPGRALAQGLRERPGAGEAIPPRRGAPAVAGIPLLSGERPLPAREPPFPTGETPLPTREAPLPTGETAFPSGERPFPTRDTPLPRWAAAAR